MKNLFLFAIALLVLAGCTPQAGTDSAELSELEKENIELVKKMIEGFENEDVSVLKEVFSPNFIVRGPKIDDYDTLKEDQWEKTAQWFERVDNIDYDDVVFLTHTVPEGEDLAGDWVMCWATVSWLNIGIDKTVKFMYHFPSLIEDGKIVFQADYFNQWDLYEQMGAELEWDDDMKDSGDEDTDDDGDEDEDDG